jgi:hypothetical protein
MKAYDKSSVTIALVSFLTCLLYSSVATAEPQIFSNLFVSKAAVYQLDEELLSFLVSPAKIIKVSPDGSTSSFPVDADLTCGGYTRTGLGTGFCSGRGSYELGYLDMTVGQDGNLYVTNVDRVDVYAPDGTRLDTLNLGLGVTSITKSLRYAKVMDSPIPDIKANGSDGPIIVPPTDPVSITVSLEPGDYPGYPADWWCAAWTPFDWYYYDVSKDSWKPGLSVTYQGPLFTLSTFEVLNMMLPQGEYTFYFGVDGSVNGNLDEPLFYDSVGVSITP